jgi:DNA uptake protein ComE-like DNA-binding protein
MAKANVNTTSRAQWSRAGIRAELADEILKLRRKEKITSLKALNQLPGIGPFTYARLRTLLDFTDQAEEPTR